MKMVYSQISLTAHLGEEEPSREETIRALREREEGRGWGRPGRHQDGVMELGADGSSVPDAGMDRLRLLVLELLPAGSSQLPEEKVKILVDVLRIRRYPFFWVFGFWCVCYGLPGVDILLTRHFILGVWGNHWFHAAWWGWISISWCSTWRSTRRISYTTRVCSSAPPFRGSTARSSVPTRSVVTLERIFFSRMIISVHKCSWRFSFMFIRFF